MYVFQLYLHHHVSAHSAILTILGMTKGSYPGQYLRSSSYVLDLLQFCFIFLHCFPHICSHCLHISLFLVACIFIYIIVCFTSHFYSLHFLAFLAVFLNTHGSHLIFSVHIYLIYFVAISKVYKGFDIYVCICWKNLCLVKFFVSSKLKELICHIYLSYLFPN